MDELVYAMTDVEYPAMRREVLGALASLADVDYQRRAWIQHKPPPPTRLDNLDLNVNILFDDCAVLPNPEERVGTVLRSGDEVPALRSLGVLLGGLIDQLGNVPDSVYLESDSWPEVARRGGLALAAMVRDEG